MGLPKTSTKRDKIDILETLQSIAGAKWWKTQHKTRKEEGQYSKQRPNEQHSLIRFEYVHKNSTSIEKYGTVDARKHNPQTWEYKKYRGGIRIMHSKKNAVPHSCDIQCEMQQKRRGIYTKKLHSIQCYEVKLKTFCYEQVVDKRIELLLPDWESDVLTVRRIDHNDLSPRDFLILSC